MKKILVVAAHPDDEIIGCGGSMCRFVDNGCEVRTLILGEGITSRDSRRNSEKRKGELQGLSQEMIAANRLCGVEKVYSYNFPDNRFDSVALLDIVKAVEEVKKEFKPDTIFTHFEHDTNIDHKITYLAVITATRPMKDECVKEIYSFNVLSSTEWSFPQRFSADMYINIESYIDQKIESMKIYASELREYPHPRSLEGLRISAEYWGLQIGCRWAEPFKTVRKIV